MYEAEPFLRQFRSKPSAAQGKSLMSTYKRGRVKKPDGVGAPEVQDWGDSTQRDLGKWMESHNKALKNGGKIHPSTEPMKGEEIPYKKRR